MRFAGINARELSDPGGPEARDRLAVLLPAGHHVTIRSVQADKYSGRVIAEVVMANGTDVGRYLLANGWAAPYDGRGKTSEHVPPWPREDTA